MRGFFDSVRRNPFPLFFIDKTTIMWYDYEN